MIQGAPKSGYRTANKTDIPFLARMTYEATLPPLGRSFWDDLLQGTETETQSFLRAMFQNEASNWGNLQDFIILEVEGQPAAACAVFKPDLASGTEAPLDLGRLGQVASSLAWSRKTTEIFQKAFETAWGEGNANLLKPQADLIIESFSVAPAHRGKGFGTTLIEAAFDHGRHLHAESIGIMVIHGNDAAQALYEKHFEPYLTFHAAYFDNEIQGVTKYKKDLRA